MNICFFSQEYPPETHVGGIGTYTYNMATALAKLNHTVHVIASSANNSESTVEEDRVWVHRIKKPKPKLKELEQFYYSYLISRKICSLNCHFDIVHSSEFAGEAFFFSLNKKFPLITRLATPFFLLEELNGKMYFGPRPLFNWMEKKQTVKSDGIFTSTKALAKAVSDGWKINPSQIEVIPNSIDLSRVEKLGSMPAPDILNSQDFILYFGRLEERKGVCELARALTPVFNRFPRIKMVFVGSDLGYQGSSMRQYVTAQAGMYSGNLIFFDNLSQKKLFPIVRLAKLVILPALWEAFGFVCVEAMALGRPVIATSGSGFEEIIENNISGYLVEPGNSVALAERIIRSLNDEAGRRRISEGARVRAQEFEVSKIAPKLLAYYERIREKWLKKQSIS